MPQLIPSPSSSLAQDNYNLALILPYDPAIKIGKRLKDGLKEYLFLVMATEEAMNALKESEFYLFDPLVGENACQIRAVKLAKIFSEGAYDPETVLDAILRVKNRLNELLEDAKLSQVEEISLKDLIEKENLAVTLNYREAFLIKSYILSKVKVSRPSKNENPLVKNEYTDAKKIKELNGVGTMFAENLVKHLRERVALHSVAFVQQIAPGRDEMVSEKFMFSHRGLHCLPCFWMSRTLMHHALSCQIPIVLVAEQKAKNRNFETIQKIAIAYKPTSEGYVEVPLSSLDENVPALFLLGSTCKDFEELPDQETWKKELVEKCPIDLILAYAATHRQYPDPSVEGDLLEKVNDKEYEFYKQKAEEWGCSSTNPSRFFLAHAFCDKLANLQKHITLSS